MQNILYLTFTHISLLIKVLIASNRCDRVIVNAYRMKSECPGYLSDIYLKRITRGYIRV